MIVSIKIGAEEINALFLPLQSGDRQRGSNTQPSPAPIFTRKTLKRNDNTRPVIYMDFVLFRGFVSVVYGSIF